MPLLRRDHEPGAEPLPVMFFIHGGGYILGSSATPIYDGVSMARRGCVYVSANLSAGSARLSGHRRWLPGHSDRQQPVPARSRAGAGVVRDNIAAFGGTRTT